MDAQTQVQTDDVSFRELIDLLILWKWRVVALTLLLTAAAAIASLVMPKTYRASIVVSALSNTPGSGQMGGLAGVMSDLTGIAALAGLSGTDSRKAESIAVLQSEALTEAYIRDNNLLPVLFAKDWDAEHQRWKTLSPRRIPTLWKANQQFKRHVRAVTTDTHSGLVTMTITWTDPKLAAQWANGLVKLTNDYLRGKAIAESERNIVYLEGQASKTDMVGVKQAIYSILQNEIDKEMLARGSDDYALKVVDPAFAPELQYQPQPVLWTLLGVFAGLLLSVLAAFLYLLWRR